MSASVAHARDPVASSADDGDERRWNELIATHRPTMAEAARRMCRNHFDPDDIVQSAVVRAMRARTHLRDPAKLQGWLVRIVTNVFLDENRRRRRHETVPLEPGHHVEVPEVEHAPWDDITDGDLAASIAKLPVDVRDTYRAFAIERRSYSEMAKHFGVPAGTIATRIRRARKHLRELLVAGERGAE